MNDKYVRMMHLRSMINTSSMSSCSQVPLPNLFKSGGDPVYPGPALGRGVPTQECEFHFDSDQPEIPSFCNIAREHEITYQLTVALKDSKENLEFDLCFNLTTH